MQIPARVHYAALAMMELASAQDRPEPMSIREIVSRHGIPQPFLVQILQQLKTAGWVSSTRGSSGGYRLMPGLSGLTLLEIAEVVGCADGGCSAESLPNRSSNQLKRVWDDASRAYRDVLAGVTLGELAAGARESESAMFYI
ncbi:MAG TPA: transcriptional regulator, Rrf2 [Planctomycetaceae bacterium]|nr:transcriptional regulator, Rrf2 [Planctomycetaceae bacterium]